MSEPSVDWTVSIGTIIGLLAAVAGFWRWVGGIDQRVRSLEERAADRDKERDERERQQAVARAGVDAQFRELHTLIHDALLDMARNYTRADRMTGIEGKIDTVLNRIGAVEGGQRAQEATLRGLQEKVEDVKNALDRRPE